jgi:hypothetical protein
MKVCGETRSVAPTASYGPHRTRGTNALTGRATQTWFYCEALRLALQLAGSR